MVCVGCAPPAPCDQPPRFRLCPEGTGCSQHADCASSSCVHGACASACTSARECGAGSACLRTSGVAPDGCGTLCPAGFAYEGDHQGLTCVDGVIVSCASAADPDARCDACGCRDAAHHCFRAGGFGCDLAGGSCTCAAPREVGAGCDESDDCASSNCSAVGFGDGRCLVAAGSACGSTAAPCVYCDLPSAGGSPVCRESCRTDADCTSAICVAHASARLACHVECTHDALRCTALEHCLALVDDAARRSACVPN